MRRVGRAVSSLPRARDGALSSRLDSVLALELVDLALQLLSSGYELLANSKYERERNGHQCNSDGVNRRRSHTDPPQELEELLDLPLEQGANHEAPWHLSPRCSVPGGRYTAAKCLSSRNCTKNHQYRTQCNAACEVNPPRTSASWNRCVGVRPHSRWSRGENAPSDPAPFSPGYLRGLKALVREFDSPRIWAEPAPAVSTSASAGNARHSPPIAEISDARLSSLSSRRAVTTSLAPAFASLKATTRPIPDEAPTMRTT
jgi:hypothetical protein